MTPDQPTDGLKQRPGDQALPTPNARRDVQSMVIEDIANRRLVGIQRYGTALQPHNGRDVLRDIYEELLGAACYVRQAMAERDDPVPAQAAPPLQPDPSLIVRSRWL